MFSTDRYMAWLFDLERCNCWHLARAAWLDLTGRDIGDRTPETITRAALIGRFATDVPTFVKLPGPQEPSLALFTRDRGVPHVGVWVRGRILQMTHSGPSYTPLATAKIGFDQVEFYRDADWTGS